MIPSMLSKSFGLGLKFFRPPAPGAAQRRAAANGSVVLKAEARESIHPDISKKDLLNEIIEDSLDAFGLQTRSKTRLVARAPREFIAMIDLKETAVELKTWKEVEHMATLNAQALLSITLTLYWRSSHAVTPELDPVDRAIRSELARLRAPKPTPRKRSSEGVEATLP